MAAQQGVSTAMHQLGLLAKEGFNLDEANPTHPNVWFNRAARQGNADSMYELGKFYQAIAEKAYEENPHNILEDSFAVQEMLLMYENAQVHGSYEASQELAMIYVSNTLVPFSNESGYNAINANRYQASHPSPIAKQSSWDPNFTVISLLAQCPQTQHTKEEIVMRAGLAIKNLFLPHNHKNLQDYAYNILELLPADQKTLPINGHNVEISEIHHEITKRRLNAEETATLAEKTRLEPEKKPDETAKTSQEL